MKIAYLIIAHKDPSLLSNLIHKLSSEDVHCFVHYDKNSDSSSLIDIEHNTSASLYSVYKTNWGSFNVVKAQLLLIKKAIEWGADRYTMLSGQDYPIKDNDYIKRFFTEHKEVGFLQARALPDPDWSEHQGGMYRVNRVHFRLFNRLRAFPMHTKKEPFRMIFNKLAGYLHKHLLQTEKISVYYNGSTWWSLTNSQVLYILDQSKDKSIHRAFKYARIPDELFYHSILNNADQKKFYLKSELLHFIQGLYNSSHPDILDESHFKKIKASPYLFARKMEPVKSSKLLQLLS